jgi:putative ABC transport system substrate-binding protein
MRRRDFITMFGSAAAWPLTVHAQQATPVIGFFSPASPEDFTDRLRAFRQGLGAKGYVDGRNVTIEYYSLEGQSDDLPSLMADLVRRGVAVIVTPGSNPASHAAKAATATIPIVFAVNEDPVGSGLVASLVRPGGNATGINSFVADIVAQRLALLHELVPRAVRIAVLVNPANVQSTEATLRDIPEAARAIGLQVQGLKASTSREIETAFATLVSDRADALFIAPDAFFGSQRVQFATLATRYAVPTVWASRDAVEAGGLLSYTTNTVDVFRHVGFYTGLMLKGVKPADLPVVQTTTFELVINLQTARLLRIDVPPTLLARADEVISVDDGHADSSGKKLRSSAKSKRGGQMRRRAEFSRGSQRHSRLPASGTSMQSFKLQSPK